MKLHVNENKNHKKYIILSYGLFLGWLLSFLYNGPALLIIFDNTKLNIGYLAVAYILTPAIIFFYLGFYSIQEQNKTNFMNYGIFVCMIGTVFAILMKDINIYIPTYILVGLMGIFSVFFITGWGCYFVKLIELQAMYKYMAFVICLGYILFHINEVFKYYKLDSIVIISLFIYLGCAYLSTKRLTNISKPTRQEFNISLPVDLLVMMCFLMFLLNVGGGMVQTFVSPLAEKKMGNIHIIDIIIYFLIIILICRMKKKPPTEVTLTIAIVMIACGYMTLILLAQNPIPAYILIILGYAILDIFIWTLVGEMGYIFGKPVKIFSFIMASNLMAVFVGNILGTCLTNTNETAYGAITISAICAVIGFAFLPHINKLMQNGIDEMINIKNTIEVANGVVTEDRAVQILTNKELEIFKLMLLGLKNKEIADRANITENTMKGHARSIYKKFEVKNKKELLSSFSEEKLF